MNNEQYTKAMERIDKIEQFVNVAEKKVGRLLSVAEAVLTEVGVNAGEFFAGMRAGIEQERARLTKQAADDVWGQATDSPGESPKPGPEQQVLETVARLTQAYRRTQAGKGMTSEEIADKVKSVVDEILKRRQERGNGLS
jgi:hypothetical protein